jgi:hypothetical protein
MEKTNNKAGAVARLQLFCKPLVCALARAGLQMCCNVRLAYQVGFFYSNLGKIWVVAFLTLQLTARQ